MADLHLAIEPGTDVALFHGMLHLMLWEELDRSPISSPRTRRASTQLKAHRARIHAARRRADLRHRRGRSRHRPRAGSAQSGRRLSLYCQGLNQSSSRHREKRRADQPAPRDRPDRQARRRAVLADRPAERDGRARSRRHGDLLSAHRDLADPAHRAEVARAVGRRRRAGAARADRGRAVRRARRRHGQDGLDRVHEPRAVDARPGDRARGRSRARSSSCCRKPTPTPRPPRSPTCCCPRPAGARRKARSPIPSGASRACARRCPRRAKRAPTGRSPSTSRARLEARLRAGPRRRCSRMTIGGGDFRRARGDDRGRDLDITGLSLRAARAIGPQQWPFPAGARAAGQARLYADGVSRPPTAARVSAADRTCRSPSRRRALSVPPEHRPPARPVARHEPHRPRAALFAHAPEPALELHPLDLARRGLSAGDLVRVPAARRTVLPLAGVRRTGRARCSRPCTGAAVPEQRRRQRSQQCAVDPRSFQPELKHAAVRLEKAELPWRVHAAVALGGQAQMMALRERLQPLLASCGYAALGLRGTPQRPVLTLQAAMAQASHAWLDELTDACAMLPAPTCWTTATAGATY